MADIPIFPLVEALAGAIVVIPATLTFNMEAGLAARVNQIPLATAL